MHYLGRWPKELQVALKKYQGNSHAKKVCYRHHSKFYKPEEESRVKPRPLTVIPTPSKFNIHLYSKDEIEKAHGLNQQRLRFWNDKVVEMFRLVNN